MIDIMKYQEAAFIKNLLDFYRVKGYLVGGAIRDIILGEEPADFDFSIECSDSIHLLICKNLEKDIKKITYNEHYHTANFKYKGSEIDIVMSRKENYEGIASKPIVEPSNIIDDLKRRDFTINSMAIPLYEDSNLIDPLSGLKDLEDGVIRVIHDKSFKDDPIRIFRGIKYASRFGFHFETKTLSLIYEAIDKGWMNYLKPGRIKNEIVDIIDDKNPLKAVGLVAGFDLLSSIFKTKIDININFDEEYFKKLNNNKRLAVLFYKNNEEKINLITELFQLSNDTVKDIHILKDICNVISNREEPKIKKADFNMLRAAFYYDERIKKALCLIPDMKGR